MKQGLIGKSQSTPPLHGVMNNEKGFQVYLLGPHLSDEPTTTRIKIFSQKQSHDSPVPARSVTTSVKTPQLTWHELCLAYLYKPPFRI